MATEHTIQPEYSLLLHCCRASLEEWRQVCISELVSQSTLRWDHILETAQRHSLIQLLCWHLQTTHKANLPEGVRSELQRQFQRNTRHNLATAGALTEAANAFEACGIPLIPFKGPVLAEQAYRNLALRQYSDIDLLVHPTDLPQALETLQALGYEQVQPEPVFHHYQLIGRNYDVAIELHWQLEMMPTPSLFDSSLLWKRAKPSQFQGATVLTPAAEDLLLYLCSHGSKHIWRRFLWLVDVAELIKQHAEAINWDYVMGQAEAMGAMRLLLLTLHRADGWLDCPLPDVIQRPMQRDRMIPRLAHLIDNPHPLDAEWVRSRYANLHAYLYLFGVRYRVPDWIDSVSAFAQKRIKRHLGQVKDSL